MVQKKKEEQVNIFLAAYEGRFNEVKALVEDNNKIINSKDEDERTPLHWAISGSKVDIAEYLIKAGSDVDAEDEASWTPLMIAVSVGNMDIVQLLLEAGCDINAQNENGQTALHYAASKNRLEIAKELFKQPDLQIDLIDKQKQTALHRAALKSNKAFVVLLVEHHININARDAQGNTALHIACEEGCGDIAVYLMQHGANAELLNNGKHKPIELAEKQVQAYIRDETEVE